MDSVDGLYGISTLELNRLYDCMSLRGWMTMASILRNYFDGCPWIFNYQKHHIHYAFSSIPL